MGTDETGITLLIDDTCNPNEVLQVIGNGIKVLSSCIKGNNKNETESLKWIIALLAGGVTEISLKIQH